MRSWYGEPRHEQRPDGAIEFERYGQPNHDEPPDSIEFVPEVEYRTDATGGAASERPSAESTSPA